jgi:alkanesulfonate monooxygenase SsuD/methylene tetrahydromethanopterin reductase-like flavin-dependent oxidoreductase (luciferase family)
MTLRFVYHYPEPNGPDADVLDAGPLGEVAAAAERAGFAGFSLSEHPVFLASGLSSYVTGCTLHPDGGTHASAGWFNWPGTGWANHAPLAALDRLDHPPTTEVS